MGGSWKELMTLLGIKCSATTAYHPQCNGLVERMHRDLKTAIRARLHDNSWLDSLPLELLGLRSAWREGPEATPAELLYGSSLRLPGQFVPGSELSSPSQPMSSIVTSFQAKMKAQRPAPSAHHSSPVPHLPSSLKAATSVLVRHDGA